MLLDRKLPTPLADTTLPNTHSATQHIQGVPLARTSSSNSHASWLNQFQSVALLERHIPGFDLGNLNEICSCEGLEIHSDITTFGYRWQARPYPIQDA